MDDGQKWSFGSLPPEHGFRDAQGEESGASGSSKEDLLPEQDISDTDLEDYDEYDDDDENENEEDGDDIGEDDWDSDDSTKDPMEMDEPQSEHDHGHDTSELRRGRKRPYQSPIPSDDDTPGASSQAPHPGRKRARIETVFDPDRDVPDEEEHFPHKTRRPPRSAVFNLLDGIFCDNAVLLNFVIHLDYRSFLNLYSVSRYFHFLINSHMRTFIMYNAQQNYPDAVKIFPWQKYDRLSMKDPLRTISRQIPGVVRDVPSLRYLGMLSYRQKTVHAIIMTLQLEDHMLPAQSHKTILKIWHLLEYPYNRWRIRVIRNRFMWTNWDLVCATTFFMKLDMRFNDPVDSEGSTSLRKLLMYQKSLTQLYKILSGKFTLTYPNLIRLWIMTHYRPDPPNNETLWGVPGDRVGHLSREGWVKGNRRLVRPDELVMAEAIRRNVGIHRYYLDIMVSGYVDNLGRTIIVPMDQFMTRYIVKKKNAGVPLNEKELKFEGKMKAKETVSRKLQVQTIQSRLRTYTRRLAAGWPLTPEQQNYLDQTIQQRNKELMHEIQTKMGTVADLSPAAKRLLEKFVRERATQFSSSNDPKIPAIKFTEADYCNMIVNLLVKKGKEQQLSPKLQLILLSSAIISVVHRARVDKRLSPVARTFLVRASIMLKIYHGESLSELEKKLIRYHALDQIKYKDRLSDGRPTLHDEEKVLVLKHFVAGWFTKKIRNGEILTEEENARFQSYQYDQKEAEQRVMRKIETERRARSGGQDVPTGEAGESSQHPEAARFAALDEEGKRIVLQRTIDRLAAKFERGEELTEVENVFIERIREGKRLEEKKKGKQRAE